MGQAVGLGHGDSGVGLISFPAKGDRRVAVVSSCGQACALLQFFFLGLAFKLGYPKVGYEKLALGLIFFGFLLEILQDLLPVGRSFDWNDLAADALGLVLVIPFLLILRRMFSKDSIDVIKHD